MSRRAVGDTSLRDDPTISATAMVDQDTQITVSLPAVARSVLDGKPFSAPFVIHLGQYNGALSIHLDRADLTRLYYTIAEALDDALDELRARADELDGGAR